MKLKLALALSSALSLLVAGVASAQTADTSVYVNAGYTGVFADLDGDDVNLGGLTGRVGAKFGRYIGVEGEGTIGVQDDDVRFLGTDVNVELKNQFAGYVVGYLPLSDRTEAFARLGYGQIEIEAEAFGQDASEDANTVAYGAGVQHFFDGVNGVRGEYTRYDLTDDGGEADSLSLSYVRRF